MRVYFIFCLSIVSSVDKYLTGDVSLNDWSTDCDSAKIYQSYHKQKTKFPRMKNRIC